MALAARLQQPRDESSSTDITLNLPSLQFESALSETEMELQYLRKQNHAVSITGCAQATFLVNILNEARQIKFNMGSPQKRSNRILQDQSPKDPLKIGILGCGRLGSQLAQCFITYGNINPKDLKVSTRRPETLEYLLKKGVDCFHDNIKLVNTSHIIFLCVLPSQLPAIADEIKLDIPPALFIYSFACSVTGRRLRQLFRTTNVLHPEYIFDEKNLNLYWDNTVNVNDALENQDTVSATCPLKKTAGVVTTNPKLAELMIFVLVNMCTHLRMNKYDVLDTVHMVVFNSATEGRLEVNDFVRKNADKDESFPLFDLIKVMESNTAVLKRLGQYADLFDSFEKKYSQVFEDYKQQKMYKEMYQN